MVRLLGLRCRLFTVMVALVALACVFPLSAQAEVRARDRRAVVVLLNAVNVDDLAQAQSKMPNLLRLLKRQGAIGLMNSRTGSSYLPEHGYATLGSGTRAVGNPTSPLAFMSGETYENEPAGVIYTRNTGFAAPTGGAVALDFPNLLTLNAKLDHPVQIGALGASLAAAGRSVALIGDADDSLSRSRLAALVAMDARGRVPMADIGGKTSVVDERFPSGRRTDYRSLLDAFNRYYDRANLIVIETGDTFRINANAAWLTPQVRDRARQESLRRFDAFLGQLSDRVDWDRTRLILVAPQPSAEAIDANNYLTFAVLAGNGVAPGFLYTPTTRRTGLVTNSDIAATVMEWLGTTAPPEVTGRAMTGTPGVGVIPSLADMNRQIVATYTERPIVLKSYVVLQIVIIAASILGLFVLRKREARVRGLLQRALLALTAVPLALLILPTIAFSSVTADVLLVIGLSVALTVLALVVARRLGSRFAFLYSATALVILIDVALGSKLNRASILGYDPASGARYYGLGNEYMGVLIGATLIAATAFIDRFPKLARYRFAIVLVPLAVVTVMTGASTFGANVGGFIGAAAALVATATALRKRPVTLRAAGIAVLGVIVLFGGLAAYDALRPTAQESHFGELIHAIAQQGPQAFLTVASRKISMNLRLMRYTPWADGLLTFIVAIGLLFYRPIGVLRNIIKKNPYFNKGFWGALIGAAAAFAANDSGVVAAATLMLYPIALLIALALEETALSKTN